MAICNLFKELSKSTGEFLMFSQYAEDLTRNNSQGYKYRVVPSKFIAANIDFSKFKYSVTGDLNVDFPTYLQNYFENGCAVCKNKKDISWDPTISSNIFWNAMIEGGLITAKKVDKSESQYYVDEFKYINDINIQSYNEVSGMGYSEIYCYIPNDAREYKYGCSELTGLDPNYTVVSTNESVEGYDKGDGLLSIKITQDHKYFINKRLNFYFEDNNLYKYDVVSDKYDVNCIIILYNINSCDNSGNNTTAYENIPLGIYLPGTFEGNNINNIITKHVHNADIFNSGTSYGIRICSRFSVSPDNELIKSSDISNVDSSEYDSLCQVMGGISDNLAAMKKIVNSSIANSGALKDTLTIFKNSRTNVPYPVTFENGKQYWFVNGRNTEIEIPQGNTTYEAYSSRDINDAIISYDGIDETLDVLISLYNPNIKLEPGKMPSSIFMEKKFPTGSQEPTTLNVAWMLKNRYNPKDDGISFNNVELEYPNGIIKTLSDSSGYSNQVKTFKIEHVKDDGKYKLYVPLNITQPTGEPKIEKKEGILDFKFCLPIYFGMIESDISKNGKDSATGIINNILKGESSLEQAGIKKYIYPSLYNKISFKSNGGRIVYAYPAINNYDNSNDGDGKLKKIINLNNMDDCIDDFTTNKEPSIIKVYFPESNEYVDYYMYYTKESTGSNVNVEFEFTKNDRQIDNSFIHNEDLK